MFHDVPYTDFHELNLDFLLREFRKFGGLKLAVQGDKLVLMNDKDEVVSSVTVSYATKALTDKNGKDITAYIYTVAGVGDTVVFTHGDGTTTSLTVPYAEKAKYDLTGHELEDYIYNVQVVGDKLRITHGDGTVVDITVPYAIKASTDINDKPIDTYATTLAVDGNSVVLRDSMGRLLDSITVPYATKALQDVDGDAIKSTYGNSLQTGTTTVILKAKDGSVLSTITVPYATDAGHADEADHATVSTDATNAIETITVSGDQIVFTTYGGVATSITAPYAVKAQKDDLGNTIKTTYVANVTQDSGSGVLTFWDAMGTEICHLTPIAGVALKDNYGNDIADFVKSIVVSQNSDYVTVTHGTGTTDTLTIHYSETAWKDTNGNVIKNFYISYLECVEDVEDGHYKIVAYNGDTPRAELFRFEVTAYSAQTDINGKDLTSYVADVSYNAGQEIEVKDGNGNLLNTLRNALDDLSDVETNQLLTAGDLLGYDGTDWTNVELQVALDDLTDVTIDATSLADGDVITYDATADKWVNKPSSVPNKDVNNNSLGLFVDATSTWTPNDVLAMNYIKQDHTLIAGDLPVISYKADRVGNPITCGILDWRIHTNAVTLSYSPIAFFNEIALGTIDSFITNATVEMWFAYPEDASKQIKVTITIDVTHRIITSNSATIVTVGGGGSIVPNDQYLVLGNYSNGTYTPTANATILSKADLNRKLAITIDETYYALGTSEYLSNVITSAPIIDGTSGMKLLKDAADGVITSGTAYRVAIQFYTGMTKMEAYEAEIVLDQTGIYSNNCSKLF